MKNRKDLEDKIVSLCEKAGCNPKLAAQHRDAYVNHRWQPHPPDRFVKWYEHHHDWSKQGTKPVAAYNSQPVFQDYLDALDVGLA